MISISNLFMILLGMVIGICYFYFVDGATLNNSFYNQCWIRHQPKWIVHNKVYLMGLFVIYKGWYYDDSLLLIIAASWIGVHLSQDIAERYWEYKKLKIK
jgi:hypothetical protein